MANSLVRKDGPVVGLVRHLRRNFGQATTIGLNLLFPPQCENCDADLPDNEDGLLLCADCRVLLGPAVWPGCPTCGGIGELEGNCSWCREHSLKFDATITLGGYRQGLSDVVQRMKRPAHDALSVAMGRLLVKRRREKLSDFRADLVVPIPMFWTRRLARRTNSPEIIASCLGRELGVPVRRRLLIQRRKTLPQKNLSPRERFQNVCGAFAVTRGRRLGGDRVMLVDDTLTTGATCSEAAKMLKQAGASQVGAVVIARAQGPQAT